MMFRWVMFAILAVLLVRWLFSLRLPWLEKMGLTKLNSSVGFTFRGRAFRLPVTLAVVLLTAVVVFGQLIYQRYY